MQCKAREVPSSEPELAGFETVDLSAMHIQRMSTFRGCRYRGSTVVLYSVPNSIFYNVNKLLCPSLNHVSFTNMQSLFVLYLTSLD